MTGYGRDHYYRPEPSPHQPDLVSDDLAAFRAELGADLPLAVVVAALSRCGGDTDRAIKALLDDAAGAASEHGEVEPKKRHGGAAAPAPAPRSAKVERTVGGAAPTQLPPVKVENHGEVELKVKREPIVAEPDEVKLQSPGKVEVKVKREPIDAGADELKVEASGEVEVEVKRGAINGDGNFHDQGWVKEEEEEEGEEEGDDEVKVESPGEVEVKVKREPIGAGADEVKVEAPGKVEVDVKSELINVDGHFHDQGWVKEEEPQAEVNVKEEQGQTFLPHRVKEEEKDEDEDDEESDDEVETAPRSKKRRREEDEVNFTTSHPVPYLNPRPIRAMPPLDAMDEMCDPGPIRSMLPPAIDWRMVVAPPPAELDELPPGRDWFFFKKSYATGLSTCRGRKMLDAGEVVHFAFPSYERFRGGIMVSHKQAAALAEIVRFSTRRSGEIGKLSPGWAKCLVPLVSSSMVMIQGKLVFPMLELRLMQEVLLYVSFYIHRSSCYLTNPENVRHPDNPLRALFKLLK